MVVFETTFFHAQTRHCGARLAHPFCLDAPPIAVCMPHKTYPTNFFLDAL